jgi:hypothetical protein
MIKPTALLIGFGAGVAAALIGFAPLAVVVIGSTGAFVTQLTINSKAKG